MSSERETIKNLYNQICYLKHTEFPPNEIEEEFLYKQEAQQLIENKK
jgi:hypothetical protein